MPGRTFNAPDYRYGFNGKENDAETASNEGGTQDYGMRIYNPALGKFLSVDPLAAKYPFQTPYAFAENTPIWATDLDGGEANLGNKLVNQAVGTLYANAEALNQIAKTKKVDSYSLQIAAGVGKWFANGLASMVSMGGQNNPQTTSSTIPPCGGVAPYTKAQKAENAWMASVHDQDEVDAKRLKEGDLSTKTEVLVGMASRYAAIFFPAEEVANIPTRPMNGQVQFQIPFQTSKGLSLTFDASYNAVYGDVAVGNTNIFVSANLIDEGTNLQFGNMNIGPTEYFTGEMTIDEAYAQYKNSMGNKTLYESIDAFRKIAKEKGYKSFSFSGTRQTGPNAGKVQTSKQYPVE